jgi:amidase
VPFTVKTNIDYAGSATHEGALALKDLIAPSDAPVVERMKAAGGILVRPIGAVFRLVGPICRTSDFGSILSRHSVAPLIIPGTTRAPWADPRVARAQPLRRE